MCFVWYEQFLHSFLRNQKINFDVHLLSRRRDGITLMNILTSLQISETQAKTLLTNLMQENHIPLKSISARCMFEITQSRFGHQCQFGLTPLWQNILDRGTNNTVDYLEFIELVHRLLDSAKRRQIAAKKGIRAVEVRYFVG